MNMSQTAKIDIEGIAQQGLFDQVPFAVAIMDAESNVVAANHNFGEYFGDWHGRKCYEVFKHESKPCRRCQARVALGDGLVHVVDESGVDRHGRCCQYVVHLTPIKDVAGEIRYIMAMASDLTETRRWQREYDWLFERVPCFVFVLDRDFHVIRANEKFRRAFGEPAGGFCYAVCKRRDARCEECPAAMTFEDGEVYSAEQVGVRRDGSPSHYVVTSTSLARGEQGVEHVLGMAVDITDTHMLESELRETRDFYHRLIRNAPNAILALDPRGHTKMMNHAARALLEWTPRQPPSGEWLKRMLPEEFFTPQAQRQELLELHDTSVVTAQKHQVPVRLSAVPLRSGHKELGRAAFIVDLSAMKRLEQDKLDAERLAAVGQTVAGLAHTIKNLLMGLEGGMYMVDTGLRRSEAARIQGGWEMLQRNFEKTTALVKDFLSFAKGRAPELQPLDPNALAKDVVTLYQDAARLQGVELSAELGPNVAIAPLDAKGMESCLTNLLSNAIDSATMRADGQGKVVLRTGQSEDELVFEVTDNGGGMDWEVKGKVFTTFFTTKGNKGTGLGLLTTRKIVQEHGGQVEVESAPGEGATFRIRLPLRRLQTIAEECARAATQPQEQI
jgi:PAS domain S-box-containing protein